MTREDNRFNSTEGKSWALEHILIEVMQRLGIRGQHVHDELLQKALDGYPGARDPEGPIGKGVREIFKNVIPE